MDRFLTLDEIDMSTMHQHSMQMDRFIQLGWHAYGMVCEGVGGEPQLVRGQEFPTRRGL
jgi:hypothetical protein